MREEDVLSERVERLEAELLRARERQLVLRDEREFWHGRAVVAENEVKRLRSLGQRNDEDLGHLTINYGL